MATLESKMRTATADGHEPATVVELIGSIDPSTLNVLEDVMDRCMAEGKKRVIFDLGELSYINSTGMGMFVQFADSLREAGGNLVLMRIQPKVLLVIEMLGLQEIFPITDDEATAMPALSGMSTGEVALVDLSEAELDALGGGGDGADHENRSAEGMGVVHLACPACLARIVCAPEGNYRCPRCRAVLQLDGRGVVRAYPEDVRRAVEMSLPPDATVLAGCRPLLEVQADAAGLAAPEKERFAQAAHHVLVKLATMLRRHASGDMRVHLFLRAGEGRVTLRIYCAGDALAPDAFAHEQGGVTRLQYQVSPLGNLVTIEQAAASAS